MDDSRKARLIENTGLYIDSHELIKRIYKLLYEMPKKDRVVMGDSIMRLSAFVEKALKKFKKILSWNETRRCFNLKKKDKFFIPYVMERMVYA